MNVIRRLIVASVLGLGLASAQAQTRLEVPYLAAMGQSRVTVVPDVFPVTVTLSETSEDSAAAQALVERLARQVLDAAKAIGVPDEDLTIGNLRISPEMTWDEASRKQVFVGNEYQRVFVLRLRKLELLRELASRLPASRNVRFQTQSFERSDAVQIRRRLREEAVKDAKAQAQSLATSAGVRLGRLYNVSDRPQGWNYATPVPRDVTNAIDVVSVSGSASNTLTSEMIVKEGNITLQAEAYLVYLIAE